MAENPENSGQRDRSPSYPLIPLGTALERLVAFETYFKRSAARPEKVGDAWGIKGKAYVDRTLAALRYFGLVDYQGAGKDRQVVISDEGRKYLRAQQEEIKREVLKDAALRPKQIAKFWHEWGTDRPADAACLDTLVLDNDFSEAGARGFLKVYNATIAFAGLISSDKLEDNEDAGEDDDGGDGDNEHDLHRLQTPRPRTQRKEQPGMKEDVFTLKEGDIVFQWPDRLSQESYDDLESWIEIVLRKVKRHIADDFKENGNGEERENG